MILVVGIVTASATGSETDRIATNLPRLTQHADERATSASAAATTVHSRSANSVSQSVTVVGPTATNSFPSSTVTTSASTNVVSHRCLAATSSLSSTHAASDLLLFDDRLLPQLPPPLIPIPDRYQPLVDIEMSESAGYNTEVPSHELLDTLSHHNNRTVLQPGSPKTGECSICMECEPNSALYPCGHMCMCYDCAVSVQKLRGALCPICRQPIIDILRIYRT